jgi:hypothetical protein
MLRLKYLRPHPRARRQPALLGHRVDRQSALLQRNFNLLPGARPKAASESLTSSTREKAESMGGAAPLAGGAASD